MVTGLVAQKANAAVLVVVNCRGVGPGDEPGAQVAIWINATDIACFHQRVWVGAGIGPSYGVTGQPTLAPHREPDNRILVEAVIDGIAAVFGAAHQLGSLRAEAVQAGGQQQGPYRQMALALPFSHGHTV